MLVITRFTKTNIVSIFVVDDHEVTLEIDNMLTYLAMHDELHHDLPCPPEFVDLADNLIKHRVRLLSGHPFFECASLFSSVHQFDWP